MNPNPMNRPFLVLDASNPTPPYEQIAGQVRAQIIAGWLREGDELPSVRQLARDLLVAPNTVARAYSELERDGWVIAAPRRGVVVAGGALAPLASVRQRRLAEEVARLLMAAAQIGVGPEELRAELERQLKLQGEAPGG